MPIANGSLTPKPAYPKGNYSRQEYPFIEGMVIGQFVNVKEAEDKIFEDRKLPWDQARKEPVLRFTFIVLLPDGKVEKGHGRPVSIQVRKPSYIGKPAPGKNVSNAYRILCRLLNNGKDLTDEQLANLEELVNQLESEQPQYYLLLEGNEETNWVKVEKIIKRVPPPEMLPKWVRPERQLDPRTADDDPNIVCSVTGEVIHGWEKSDGSWVSNKEWAEIQIAKLGDNPIYVFDDHPGKKFAPPFIGKYYRLAKAQLEHSAEPF